MKRYNENYGRYTTFHLPDIEECSFEGLKTSCICKISDNLSEEEEIKWIELECFLKTKINDTLDEEVKRLLIEILHWIEKKDAYGAALLISIFWEGIEDEFTKSSHPDKMMRYVRYLRFQ